MGTPDKVLFRSNSHWKPTSSTLSPSKTALSSSFLNQLVFLHEWWLVKADSDFHGRQLGIGGFTSHEKQSIKCFLSAPVIKRHDAVTLETVDGITITVHGHLNRSRTLENGFSHKVCNHFVFGFPYDWEKFDALSYNEDEMPTPEDHESIMLKNIFDDILQQNDDDASLYGKASISNKETSCHMKTTAPTPDENPSNHKEKKANKKRSANYSTEYRPLTRSKTRLLYKV